MLVVCIGVFPKSGTLCVSPAVAPQKFVPPAVGPFGPLVYCIGASFHGTLFSRISRMSLHLRKFNREYLVRYVECES